MEDGRPRRCRRRGRHRRRAKRRRRRARRSGRRSGGPRRRRRCGRRRGRGCSLAAAARRLLRRARRRPGHLHGGGGWRGAGGVSPGRVGMAGRQVGGGECGERAGGGESPRAQTRAAALWPEASGEVLQFHPASRRSDRNPRGRREISAGVWPITCCPGCNRAAQDVCWILLRVLASLAEHRRLFRRRRRERVGLDLCRRPLPLLCPWCIF